MNKRIRKKRGMSKITEEECWGLDITLAKYILPRLIKFKEINTMSFPNEFNSIEEWHIVLDKMIWSFDKVLKDKWDVSDIKSYKEEQERYLAGMHLFAEYFKDLWD